MKNDYLKIFCTLIMTLALCSLKAQSLQQKHQKDMELRKKQVNEVLLKAKEQQVQQKAERTNEVNMPQPATSGTSSPKQVNTQPVPAPQQKNEIKARVEPAPGKPKQLATQQKSSGK